MHSSVEAAFIPFNTPIEARLPYMYLDVKGLVTTGIGNLIDQDDPENLGSDPHPVESTFNLGWFVVDDPNETPVSRAEIEQEFNTVKFSGTAGLPIDQRRAITRLRISEATIDQMVMTRLHNFESTLQQRPEFANFQNWPADAQLALLSMTWGIGPVRFTDFVKFRAAAAGEDWVEMAAQCRIKEQDNPGVIPRNLANAVLFTIAGWTAAPEPGDFSLLVYDPMKTAVENVQSEVFPLPIRTDVGFQSALERLATGLGKPAYDPQGLDGKLGPRAHAALNAFETDNALALTPVPPPQGKFHAADVSQGTIDAVAAALDTLGSVHWP